MVFQSELQMCFSPNGCHKSCKFNNQNDQLYKRSFPFFFFSSPHLIIIKVREFVHIGGYVEFKPTLFANHRECFKFWVKCASSVLFIKNRPNFRLIKTFPRTKLFPLLNHCQSNSRTKGQQCSSNWSSSIMASKKRSERHSRVFLVVSNSSATQIPHRFCAFVCLHKYVDFVKNHLSFLVQHTMATKRRVQLDRKCKGKKRIIIGSTEGKHWILDSNAFLFQMKLLKSAKRSMK